MIARSMLPDHPSPRVRHGWRCLARGPYREELRELPDREPLTVTVCESCNGDDLTDRLRDERRST